MFVNKRLVRGAKGVSPVVATVLLIAIAVIVSIAVWYWFGSLTGKPKAAGTVDTSVAITSCKTSVDAGTALNVRNTGGKKVSKTFEVYYADNGSIIETASVVIDNLAAGTSFTVPVSGATLSTSTTYFLRAGGVPDAPFSCT